MKRAKAEAHSEPKSVIASAGAGRARHFSFAKDNEVRCSRARGILWHTKHATLCRIPITSEDNVTSIYGEKNVSCWPVATNSILLSLCIFLYMWEHSSFWKTDAKKNQFHSKLCMWSSLPWYRVSFPWGQLQIGVSSQAALSPFHLPSGHSHNQTLEHQTESTLYWGHGSFVWKGLCAHAYFKEKPAAMTVLKWQVEQKRKAA